MIIIQMMKPVEGIYKDITREYTSLRKMGLMMKPTYIENNKEYIFIGIYKGFLYGLSNDGVLKYLICTKSGDIVKDVRISIKTIALYDILRRIWLVKEDIRHVLNGTLKFKDEKDIPNYIESIEIFINVPCKGLLRKNKLILKFLEIN